jgi:electron transfer flavoprotein alpha subunit
MGHMTGSVVQRVIEQHGADNILQCLPENYAPLLVENIKKGGYTHVVAGHSAFGKNIMPRVSALLDTQQISDITGVEGEDSE